jgi:hypothetical protein
VRGHNIEQALIDAGAVDVLVVDSVSPSTGPSSKELRERITMRRHQPEGDKNLQDRANLKAILADPAKREQLIDSVIVQVAANEGVTLTYIQAAARITSQLVVLGEDPHAAVALVMTGRTK